MNVQQNFPTRLLTVLLPKVEIIALAVTGIGFALNFNKMPGALMMNLGLGALASVYFISAHVPAPFEGKPSAERKNFVDLLAVSVWKVMHIAMSVSIVGLLFFLLSLTGFLQMMTVGVAVLIACLIASGFFILSGDSRLSVFKGIAVKALSVAIIGSCLLYNLLAS